MIPHRHTTFAQAEFLKQIFEKEQSTTHGCTTLDMLKRIDTPQLSERMKGEIETLQKAQQEVKNVSIIYGVYMK